jgi:succinate-acetate transporter protein
VTTWTRSRPAVASGHAGARPSAADAAGDALDTVAAPSVLGLFGLFSATVLYGSALAGWWGGSGTPILIFPFVVMLGGLVQLVAAAWSARSAEGLPAVVHAVWGAFWLAYGLYQLLVTTRRLPLAVTGKGVAFDFGMWFVPLTAITAATALAATVRHPGLVAVLAPLTAASLFSALGLTGNLHWSLTLAGWLFVVAAAVAWFVGSALLMDSQRDRAGAPAGRRRARP